MPTTQLRSTPLAPPRPRPSTFACKLSMAVTGWIFTAFVAVHMVGNLKAFGGAEGYNGYSHWLRTAFYPLLPHEGLLWILRVVLAVSLVLHLWASALLWARGRRFRGPYRRRAYRAWTARTMPWTGILLLGFIVFHLLDLTLGIAGPATYQPATATASFAYENTIASLARPLAGGFYLVTMLALAVHLAHGLWSTTSDVGVTGGRTRAVWLTAGRVVALAVALGNASLPIAVWVGALV